MGYQCSRMGALVPDRCHPASIRRSVLRSAGLAGGAGLVSVAPQDKRDQHFVALRTTSVPSYTRPGACAAVSGLWFSGAPGRVSSS